MWCDALTNQIAECIEELEQKRLKTNDCFSTLCEAGLEAEESGDSDDIPALVTPTTVGDSEVTGDSDGTVVQKTDSPESSEDKGDVFEPQDEPRSIFADVFSEDEEEDDDDEEEDDG